MNLPFNLTETINSRYSMRTFSSQEVNEETIKKLQDFWDGISNPFGADVRIQFIKKNTSSEGEKLGTYGIIKNAPLYIGVAVKKSEQALIGLGYQFEKLVLYATSLGLGTCWLGGTFNKSSFSKIMKTSQDEIFPIISPVGYGSGKKRLFEKIMRANLKADNRLSWDNLFFMNDSSTPLSIDAAGEYKNSLELLRKAPSAVNKQPWRVIFHGNSFHFFEKQTIKAGEETDIQKIDLGIGICHFHMGTEEKNLKGHFKNELPEIQIPKDWEYITSWIAE